VRRRQEIGGTDEAADEAGRANVRAYARGRLGTQREYSLLKRTIRAAGVRTI
jgi:hypothetical protein